MATARTWKARPSVIYTKLDDGEGVLLCLDQKAFFGLNETGCLIWERIERETEVAQIANELAEEYDISADEAAEVVEEFAGQLVVDGLVSATADE